MIPRYPIYVVSKNRPESLTARFLVRDDVPFRIVVEPPDVDSYRANFGDHVVALPFENLGQGSIPARNWIWEHAIKTGAGRHWILDDNIHFIRRFYKGKRLPCESGPAFAAVEDFTDRYENIGITGLNYETFGFPGIPPLSLNVHVYSCLLIDNAMPYRWRGRYNEDTDLCLQVLSGGLCTVLVNVFLINKQATMTAKGGNTDDLYAGDGRLRMARSLQRAWPHVVRVTRRYGRPQHHVPWAKFTTPLKLKPTIDVARDPNEYGLQLQAIKPVQSARLRELLSATD